MKDSYQPKLFLRMLSIMMSSSQLNSSSLSKNKVNVKVSVRLLLLRTKVTFQQQTRPHLTLYEDSLAAGRPRTAEQHFLLAAVLTLQTFRFGRTAQGWYQLRLRLKQLFAKTGIPSQKDVVVNLKTTIARTRKLK